MIVYIDELDKKIFRVIVIIVLLILGLYLIFGGLRDTRKLDMNENEKLYVMEQNNSYFSIT